MSGTFDDLTPESIYGASAHHQVTFELASSQTAFLREAMFAVPGVG